MLNYQQQEKRDTMASVGIIAEYNPFHNGHLYQIQEIKKKYPEAVSYTHLRAHET